MEMTRRRYWEWEQSHVADAGLGELDQVRIPRTISMIPAGVQRILELGCGNGRLSNRITRGCHIIGMDISPRALHQLKGNPVAGSCDQLPFATHSVDLVICADVLEHLPDGVMLSTVQEAKRVTKKYVLIGVPFKDPIKAGYAKCNRCGGVYNEFGHLRSFSCRSLDRLFNDCDVVESAFVGEPRKYYNSLFTWGQQRLGGTYWGTGVNGICPACGDNTFSPPRRNVAQKIVAKTCFLLNEAMDWSIPSTLKPSQEIIRLYMKRAI